jgi:hypothetical protein
MQIQMPEPAQAAVVAVQKSNAVVQQAQNPEPAQVAAQAAQPAIQTQGLPAKEKFLITKDVKINEVILRKELTILDDEEIEESKLEDKIFKILQKRGISTSGVDIESATNNGILEVKATISPESIDFSQGLNKEFSEINAGGGGLGRSQFSLQEPAQIAASATLADISDYFSSTGVKPEPAQAATQIVTKAEIMGRSEAAINAAEKVAITDLRGILSERNIPQSSVNIDTVVEGKLVKAVAKIKQNEIEPAQTATQKAVNTVPSTSGNIEGVVPNTDVDTSKALPSTATPVPVSTISPSASVASMEQKMLQDRAAASPSKSEITSPELGNIASENEEQTIILSQMKDLFEKFLAAIKPRSDVNSSGGGEPGNTSSIPIAGKPANYYRRVTGNVSQTSGKGITNLGAKALS